MNYTILLPAYKSAFFTEALESIKHQTYSNFKVIVSDDCSPEDLETIFDEVVGNDSRFAYRRNVENMGSKSLVSHWNLLVDMCDTDYLVIASDDDVYEPRFLEEIDKLVLKYPQVDVLRAKAKRIQNGTTEAEDGEMPEFLSQEEFLPYFGKKSMVHCLANYVFKTSALNTMGGFPDFPKAGYSDAAAAMALATNGLASTSDVLFSFRMSSENLSSANGYDKYTEEGIQGCVQFADWYQEQIRSQVNYVGDIKQAHYNHVVEVAQYFLCRLPLHKTLRYYWQLRMRGYMNFHSTLTAIKNCVKIKC